MTAPMCFKFLILILKIVSFSSEELWANLLLEPCSQETTWIPGITSVIMVKLVTGKIFT